MTTQIETGSIVMGIDRSFPRSFYEVLATDGTNLLLLFRHFRLESGGAILFEDLGRMSIYVRPASFFRRETDHLLKPVEGITVKTTSWTTETGWDIEYSVNGKLVHRVNEVPFCSN